jgi:hypothetical protein
MILISAAGIDPVSAAAKGCPLTKILLNPDRNECVSSARAEPARCVARRHLQQRVDRDRWGPTRFVLLNKAILDAKFRVGQPPLGSTHVYSIEGRGQLEMQLNIGQTAKIAVA